MTTSSSTSGMRSTSSVRTRDTTSPTVASSSRAGMTRLIVVPLRCLRSANSSGRQSNHWCVRRSNHPLSTDPSQGRPYPSHDIRYARGGAYGRRHTPLLGSTHAVPGAEPPERYPDRGAPGRAMCEVANFAPTFPTYGWSHPLKLSIVELATVSPGTTERDALAEALRTAQHADALGLHRVW